MPVKVEWISYDTATERLSKNELEERGGLGGFFQDGMRWKDYLDNISDDHDTVADLEAIRGSIVEQRIWQGGDWHQGSGGGSPDESVPVCDGKRAWLFSFRAWGDLLAAVWSTALDRDFHYMAFYMDPEEPPLAWPASPPH